MSALTIARRCHWRYDWVEALPLDVYTILVEELVKEDAAAERIRERF